MPRTRAAKSAQKTEKVGKAKGATAVKAPSNCGSGAGGFKPGNVCGKGKRAKLAADIRAARKHSLGSTDDAAIRAKALGLKAHRRGKDGSVDNEAALHLRASLGRDKAAHARTDAVRTAFADVQAAHVAQRFRNAREARLEPVRVVQGAESPILKMGRDRLQMLKEIKVRDEEIYAKGRPDHLKEEANKALHHSEEIGISKAAKTRRVNEWNRKLDKFFEARNAYESAEYKIKNGRHDIAIKEVEDAIADISKNGGDGKTTHEYAKNQANHPDLLPPGPITERIKAYTVGDAKVAAINKISAFHQPEIEKHSTEAIKLRREVQKIQDSQMDFLGIHYPNITPEVRAESLAMRAKADALTPAIEAADARYQAALKAQRSDITRVLTVDKPMNFVARDIRPGVVTKAGPLAPPTVGTRQAIVEAHEFLGKTVAQSDVRTVQAEFGQGNGYRAHYQDSINGNPAHIQTKQDEDPAIVVHEYGHAIDDQARVGAQNPNERAQEFLAHRVGDEPGVDMHVRFSAGDPGEMGRKDKFQEMMGTEYRAYYTGRDYGPRASEITSMGMEALYRDPVKFVRADHEYAKFILGHMDGSLR